MRLLNKTREAGDKINFATYQVDMALLQMAAVLDGVEQQTEDAREEISERRSSDSDS